MWKYVLQRIVFIFITAFIILSLTFILLKLMPGDVPIGTIDQQKSFYEGQVLLGYMYRVTSPNPGVAYQYSVTISGKLYAYEYYSIIEQYGRWLSNIFTKFDWGTSTKVSVGVSAIGIISQKLGVSMKLNIISMIFSIPLGFFFGITAALKKNSFYDGAVNTVVMIAVSIPSFVLISLLVLLLATNTQLLPSTWPDPQSSYATQAKGYVIPVICLCFGTIAGFTRYMRAELTEVMSSEFLLLARTKGLTKSQTVMKHALRNSMVPIIPMVIGEFFGVLSGSMILEQLYCIPGIGQLFVSALSARDYNVIMVDMGVYTVIGLFATLLVDLSYGIIDPRIRMGAKK
jgi:oligopeptide transport system permease protein